MKRPALLKDRTVEISLGIGCFVLSTVLLWDAYEGRGRKRSFLAGIFLP